MADVLLALQSDAYAIAAAIAYPTIFYNPALEKRCDKLLDKTVCAIIAGAIQMDVIYSANTDKPEKNKVTGQQNQIDNLRKMMLAMVDDTRTILLKLSERLIMLQQLGRSTKAAQQQIAQDTMDYYAPLANRLGIGHLKWQLEDWAFRYLNPVEYQKISNAFHMRQKDRVRLIHEMIAELKTVLIDAHIKNAKISGRIKHIYSIYKKIQRKKTTVDNIYDANAVRILVPTITDCYTVLSAVHAKWTPITDEFDDYIAKPKQNGYQSIHTAILRDDGTPVEIQIRTIEMHEKSELGIAAHWKYKENKSVHDHDEQKIKLLRELIESQTHLYPDAFHDRVYVFSPIGNVFDLQKGATPLDFAYLIHSDIGHRCRGAKINGVLVPLTHPLQTGDHIEIITAKEGHPSQDWLRGDLGYLKTTHAKQKVRHWFRKQNAPTTTLNKLPTPPIITAKNNTQEKLAINDFSVLGATRFLTQLAKCCHPVQGDSIIGYVTRSRGISVHKTTCHNITDARQHRSEKLITISWKNQFNKKKS
jgi:GTP pyrophosphokinase